MFENLKKGFRAASATRKLVFKDRGLFMYPVLSGIITLVEAIIVFGSMFLISIPAGGINSVLVVAALIVFYVVVYFTGTYFTMALLIAFKSFAGGKKIGMSEALGMTAPYSRLILEWALFYTVLVMILRLVESRLRGIPQLIIGALGSFAISIATMFAVQIILENKVGPIKAVEGSVDFVKKNFGTTFGGLFYSDLYGLAFSLIGFLALLGAFGLLIAVGGVGGIAVAGIVGIVGLVLIVFGSLISGITFSVYKLILYDHYNGAPLPPGFTADLFQIKTKKGKQNSNMPGGFAGPAQ